ncbi:MAG TPA: biopolymer transporter ExbD [Candidatus Hydrogenedentes bacterium]|nr:biopolymer transporter ExbD [Candidatus Hydrogenedentota bacterium]HNT86275.1 biopolymer transporter ExbD [Candidatus Hydrogenedentota bacterium]
MKFGRRPNEEADAIPMAPLIDIIFLTLVFFMWTAVYAHLESEIDVDLPTADSAVASERMPGEIIINLLRPEDARVVDGKTLDIVVNERVMDVAALQSLLERVAKYFPGGSVIIRGDRKATLGRAIEVLDACSKVDIQDVAFAALKPEEERRQTP